MGDEVPGRLVGPLVTAEVGPRLIGPWAAEAVAKHPVDGRGRVDPDVLSGGVDDQRPQVLDHGNRIHPLPEPVGGAELDPDVVGADPLDQFADAGSG